MQSLFWWHFIPATFCQNVFFFCHLMSFFNLTTPPPFCIKLLSTPKCHVLAINIYHSVAMKLKECHKVALIGLGRMLTDCCSATMWPIRLDSLFLIGRGYVPLFSLPNWQNSSLLCMPKHGMKPLLSYST